MNCGKILLKSFYKDFTIASVPLNIPSFKIGDRVNDGTGTIVSARCAEPLNGIDRLILVIKGKIKGDELYY